jgi:predicted MPP superfamily phosphohydrolase
VVFVIPSVAERPAVVSRRKFLIAGAAVIAGTGAGVVGYTLGIEPHWLEIVQRDLAIAGLPAPLEGKVLAQVSDIHIGMEVSDDYVVESFDRVARYRPDIVVYTGDFLTYRVDRGEAQFAQLRDVLSHAPRGRLATVGILGNHDYGRNWSEADVAARVVTEAERAGIQVLRNAAANVNGLDVFGVDDLWARRADTVKALAARAGNAAIALCHNPDGLDELAWGDYRGWVLAGHTHGGQCKPPFLPPPLLPVRNRRYVAGEVDVDGRKTLYISRGVGHLIQARFNVRPEVPLFTLRRA